MLSNYVYINEFIYINLLNKLKNKLNKLAGVGFELLSSCFFSLTTSLPTAPLSPYISRVHLVTTKIINKKNKAPLSFVFINY